MLLLILSIVVIVLGTVRFRVHPFLVLLLTALGYGLLAGLPVEGVVEAVQDGFGGILGSIGLVIVLGVVIGSFLEKTGGAQALASAVLRLIGPRRLHAAMALMGYVVSIPVFCDSGFILLHPLNSAMSRRAGVRLAGTAVALALGLLATHVMVPPTPGPLAAAGILGANVGRVILVGLAASLLALLPAVVFARWAGERIHLASDELAAPEAKQEFPPAWKAALPIAMPIVLIVAGSVEASGDYLGDGFAAKLVALLGTPVVALLVGLGFALLLPKRWSSEIWAEKGWVGEALRSAATILLVTGAGGIFGKMLQQAGLGEAVTDQVSAGGWGLLMPFAMAAVLKTAQGSSTVAMITAASVVGPLLPALGLDGSWGPELAVIAIGAGALVVSHANDSYFWVVTQLCGMDVGQGYRLHTLGTAVLGCTAMLVVYVLWLVLV